MTNTVAMGFKVRSDIDLEDRVRAALARAAPRGEALLAITDVPALFDLIDHNRAWLRRWLPWLDRTATVADCLGFVEISRRHLLDRRAIRLAIRDRSLVGIASLERISEENRTASIGYWLAETATGRGLVSRAVQILCRIGFAELHLERIELSAAVDNRRSRAVAERLGFVREGTLRAREWLYDHAVDHAVYSLIRADVDDLATSTFPGGNR